MSGKTKQERYGGCSRLEETKEIWQPNAVCDPGFNFRLEKHATAIWGETTGEIRLWTICQISD